MKRNTHLDRTRNTPRYISKYHDAQYNQIQGANDDDKQGNKLVGNSTFPVKELSRTITNNMMNLMSNFMNRPVLPVHPFQQHAMNIPIMSTFPVPNYYNFK